MKENFFCTACVARNIWHVYVVHIYTVYIRVYAVGLYAYRYIIAYYIFSPHIYIIRIYISTCVRVYNVYINRRKDDGVEKKKKKVPYIGTTYRADGEEGEKKKIWIKRTKERGRMRNRSCERKKLKKKKKNIYIVYVCRRARG